MARVDLEVNGRFYQLNCEDGQEQRLRDMAAYVDGRLRQITGGGKSGTDAQMLVVTALVLADELQEVMAGRGLSAPKLAPSVDEAEAVSAIDAISKRIEEVAARLERA
ncbi:cell division protein ZapA [Azospirillum sp.]|uniref:cell division protein ZapA n=1 Tax=Azospirillum sp. TaxID=34012 RepID=UPI003D760C3D